MMPLHGKVPRRVRALGGVWASLLLSGLPSPLQAQIVVPEDRGTVATGLLLRQLDGEKRILMIGAHPDDEDTALLAAFARGMGARTAYLSLTRGEGGQNLIGPELDEGLGIIRTGELEAARRLDGAEQYFSRAFDFGFSKTADETFGYWPREELLRDAVEVVRRFRPHVVVSVFSGTPRDGHGHHQVAGMIATEAFHASGDALRFPDQLAAGLDPWQPSRLFQRFRGLPGGEELAIPTGGVDPLLGRSHFQVAMESRSQHRSQDQGVPQTPGPRESTLVLVAEAGGGGGGDGGLFAGVDTTLVGLAAGLQGEEGHSVRRHLEGYRARLAEAAASLDALDPSRAVPSLAAAAEEMGRALQRVRALGPSAPAVLMRGVELRDRMVRRALLSAASITLDARVDRSLAVPGESVQAELLLWNGGPFHLEVDTLGLGVASLPPGWRVEALDPSAGEDPPAAPAGFFGVVPPPLDGTGPLPPATLRRALFRVSIPPDAGASRLYFLREAREGEMYRWPDDPRRRGLPRDPAPLVGEARLILRLEGEAAERAGGITSVVLEPEAAARHVGVDKALGEFQEPFLVVPALSVSVDPGVLAWPLDERSPRSVEVRVRSEAEEGRGGRVHLEAPDGWRVEPASYTLQPAPRGSRRSFTFQVHPPERMQEGSVIFRAVVRGDDGVGYREGFTLIDYPHVQRAALFHESEVLVPVFPVRVAEGLRVGYVMGSGDDGAEALRQMGATVELLAPGEVQSGSLDRFDAVVLGVRVYEVVPAMFGANAALLDYARGGGTVVVQYNKYEYPDGNAAPYPVRMARPHDRITDEAAPVTLLDAESPVFTTPNRIVARDFDGWVQERGLYFLSEWDDRFVPLLEMADPGEAPKRGGLVVAPVGEGVYVYTGLAFFRQFPAGVPGAYRLLANLVSLRGETWRAHSTGGAGGGAPR
jgi:LmbE family N-acetylglucosaminyl deacetylase